MPKTKCFSLLSKRSPNGTKPRYDKSARKKEKKNGSKQRRASVSVVSEKNLFHNNHNIVAKFSASWFSVTYVGIKIES